jgi:GNAT superfamily N-acetyltransferase
MACSGCGQRAICESRPTRLVCAATSEHVLAGGTRVLIRPLLYSDRREIAAGYQQLSDQARRLRFFSAPPDLSDADLEYLANLDYRDHFAWAAFALDEAGQPGVGVARYIRRRDEPSQAEAAVTVLDGYGHRGLGTLLLVMLAERARQNGIATFVSYVLWANEDVINALVTAGARVEPAEPGVARVEIDLPGDDDTGMLAGIGAALRTFARSTLALLGLDRRAAAVADV